MKPDCCAETTSTVLGDAELSFNERDRALFLKICGICQLSECVKVEPLTESLRPCPSMQALVRTLVPYIQRFLYHHDELYGVYSELVQNNIRAKIKQLYFGQVRSLQFVQNKFKGGCMLILAKDVIINVIFCRTQLKLCSGCYRWGSCTSATSCPTVSW